MKLRVNLDREGTGIPFRLVKVLLEALPYGNVVRVMVRMLIYTGMRLSELDKCQMKNLFGNCFYWELGKNQTGQYRKALLPQEYLDELKIYRESHRTFGDRMFGLNATAFRRKFNMEVRPLLSDEWREQVLVREAGILEEEYKFQLKGFRKNFATILFYKLYKKWDDANVALLMVSKEMKHSCTQMTAHHYLMEFENLELEKYEKTFGEIDLQKIFRSPDHQERMMAFT